MVLIDSSVWVSFLQSEGELQLVQLLGSNEVLMHDMVQAEIAMSSTEQKEALALLSLLPLLPLLPPLTVAGHS